MFCGVKRGVVISTIEDYLSRLCVCRWALGLAAQRTVNKKVRCKSADLDTLSRDCNFVDNLLSLRGLDSIAVEATL